MLFLHVVIWSGWQIYRGLRFLFTGQR